MTKVFTGIFLILLILAGLYAAKTYEREIAILLRPYRNLDTSIQNTADKKIIDTVGETEFKKNYELYKEHSSCLDGVSPGCQVAYKHVLGQKYGLSVYYVVVNDDTAEFSGVTAKEIPNCSKDPDKCIFRIDQQTAIKIATTEKLDPSTLRMIMHEGRVLLEATNCTAEGTKNYKRILIDPSTGKILWKGESTNCVRVLGN